MTAAGVPTNDSAAYLPPPSTSTPDARGTAAAGKPATDAPTANVQGAPSDFQSELALQQSGTQQSGPQQIQSKALPKADPGKPGKKRSVRAEDTNLAAVTPVQITEPQKQIPPLALALALPQELAQQQKIAKPDQGARLDENAKLDENARPDKSAKIDEKATPGQNLPVPVQQTGRATSLSIAAVAQLPQLQKPAALKPSMKARQSAQPEATPNETTVPDPSPVSVTDPGKTLVLPLTPVPAVAQDIHDIPVRQEGKKPEDPLPRDQAITPAKPGASSNSQPVSPADLKLPATPAEPVASPVLETLDRAPSSPSELAFAARLSAAQQKTDQSVAASPSQAPAQSLAVSGSQTAVQIPVRYAATAQIIQRAAPGTQQDGPKQEETKPEETKPEETKRAAAPSYGPARPDARTDMVLPQFETVSQSAAGSRPTAPQQPAPPARAESILEPPPAPPTSSHDIRVRVPDSNGGSTQVRFVESGGEVRVSVRTADASLAQNLRTHLNDLTQRLSDGGMPAEIWKPVSNAASSQNDSQQQFQQGGRGSGGQGSGGQGEQQDRRQNRPAWLDEMEASLHGEQN